jgi:hypothetical protein
MKLWVQLYVVDIVLCTGGVMETSPQNVKLILLYFWLCIRENTEMVWKYLQQQITPG